MSFTAAYTELYAIRDERVCRPTELHSNPRILDPEGFERVPDAVDMSEKAFQKNVVKGEQTDHSDYPPRTWETLQGFKTHKPAGTFGLHRNPDKSTLVNRIENHEDYRRGPLGYGYNIERVGLPYDGIDGSWRYFFGEVSKHTEPFAFFHSAREHTFPDVTEFGDGEEVVYYVEAGDGDLYVERQVFQRVSAERLVAERDRTAAWDASVDEDATPETDVGDRVWTGDPLVEVEVDDGE